MTVTTFLLAVGFVLSVNADSNQFRHRNKKDAKDWTARLEGEVRLPPTFVELRGHAGMCAQPMFVTWQALYVYRSRRPPKK
jgi:hypothetical protein